MAELKERSYFLWMFLSIITLGICGIIYMYYTMDDLNKLYARYNKGEAVSVLLILILTLLTGVGGLVYQYLIYEKLHDTYNPAPCILNLNHDHQKIIFNFY